MHLRHCSTFIYMYSFCSRYIVTLSRRNIYPLLIICPLFFAYLQEKFMSLNNWQLLKKVVVLLFLITRLLFFRKNFQPTITRQKKEIKKKLNRICLPSFPSKESCSFLLQVRPWLYTGITLYMTVIKVQTKTNQTYEKDISDLKQ